MIDSAAMLTRPSANSTLGKRLALAAVFVLLGGFGSAAEPVKPGETLYTVELVVFRFVNPLGVSEDWSVESAASHSPASGGGETETNEADAPQAAPARHLAVRRLSAAEFRLAGTEAALERNSSYEVLGHVGWIQSATARGAGLTVDLQELGIKDASLRGTATLEQGRYLYLGFELAYAPANPPNSLLGAGSGTQPVVFTLKQKRRVKSAERHYFDHPAFGVIATVAAIK